MKRALKEFGKMLLTAIIIVITIFTVGTQDYVVYVGIAGILILLIWDNDGNDKEGDPA